jgi:hypothetical protein
MRYFSLATLLLACLAGSLLTSIFFPSYPISPEISASGVVHDEVGPVAQARVHFQGAAEPVVHTDTRGRFRLPGLASARDRVCARKEGYVITGAPVSTNSVAMILSRLPEKDNESYHWVDPTPDATRSDSCGNCHGQIYQEWSEGKHARSSTDRHFVNLYDGGTWQGEMKAGWSLLDELPDGAGVCAACHAPAADYDSLNVFDLRKAKDKSGAGIHCDYCHKIAGVKNKDIGLTHGRYGLQLLRPPAGQLFFGPLDDADRGEDVFSPTYRQSIYCASCHEGTVFGVPVYTTYSEWLASPARREGKQCQDCHMTPTGTMNNIAPGNGGIRRDPATLGNHVFFDRSKEVMLRRALHLEVNVEREITRTDVRLTLRTTGVGHRVPTGFVDRQLLLVVEGFNAAHGRLHPLKGNPVLPEKSGRSLAGQAGLVFAKHLSDWEGRQPVPFWRARPECTDSRLQPDSLTRMLWTFPNSLATCRLRLIYRDFWEETAASKHWPDNDLLLFDHTVSLCEVTSLDWSSDD